MTGRRCNWTASTQLEPHVSRSASCAMNLSPRDPAQVGQGQSISKFALARTFELPRTSMRAGKLGIICLVLLRPAIVTESFLGES